MAREIVNTPFDRDDRETTATCIPHWKVQ
jgi:hypothetical protein